MFYRPDDGKSVCADVIPFYENGKYYLFYLRDYRDIENCGEGCPWCLLTTTDFVHFEEHGEVLVRGSEDEQDLYVYTGSVFKHEGEYYIFYTGHNPHKRALGLPEQKVLLAKSKDLYTWEKVRDFELQAPEHLEMHDYRDPFIYYDEEDKKYCMLLAGRVKSDGPVNSKGVTLILRSEDLRHWELDEEPFYAPGAFFTHECPDLFKMGDWWYLIFSEFSDKVVTTYRMAKSPNGPWITPKNDTFDCYTYYAAKTASDGNDRYLFGWNRIKNHEKDWEPGQWGGSIVVHQLLQNPDGTLRVKAPESVSGYCSEPIAVEEQRCFGTVESTDNGYLLGNGNGRSTVLFGELPSCCKMELDFAITDEVGEYGVLLRADNAADRYYAVKLETKLNRMVFDMVPRAETPVHAEIQTERYCPIAVGEKNHMQILIEGSVAVVYVNDSVAMSVRMFDHQEGCLGIFAKNTAVRYENISVSVPQEKQA